MRWIATWLILCGVAVGQADFSNELASIDFPPNTISDLCDGAAGVTLSYWYVRQHNAAGDNELNVYFENGASHFLYNLLDPHGWNRLITTSYSGESQQVAYSAYTPSIGELTHLTWVVDYENDIIYSYTNGGLDRSTSVSFGSNVLFSTDGVLPDLIGRYAGFVDRDFVGMFQDFRLYRRAISSEEIAIIGNKQTAYKLADDPDLVLRTCITTNNTGDALTGVAPNYGTGADGTYNNSPTAAPWTIQMEKPRRATINID